jgi:DNA polymerase/3'-5' exonuclease PolX
METMAHTYEELKIKTVIELREIAAGIEHEALQGYTQLNKEHLLVALCKALNLEMHAHHEVRGLNKSEVKAQIRELKKKRDEALAAHDHTRLKDVRRQIHHLKRQIHRATV